MTHEKASEAERRVAEQVAIAAGNASMQEAGRKHWNDEDYLVAILARDASLAGYIN